jgi:hypothetical protein
MAFNGTGTYVLPTNSLVPDAVAGTDIVSDDFDEFTGDIETALTNCICKDGQSTPSAPLPMGTNNHTGVGDATALDEYASANQVVDNALTYGGASAAGSDTYAVSLTISPGAYAAGNRFQFIADVDNTGACTLNINSLGAKSIKLADGNDPFDGAIQASSIADVIYDGTNFILLNPWDSALSGVTASAAELNVLDGVTGGTVTASKGVVVDGSKDIGTFGEITAATFTGTNVDGILGANTPAAVTGTTLKANTSLALATGATVTGILDEDDLATDSATQLATQQSIKKACRPNEITAQNYTGSATYVFAHGLSQEPVSVQLVAECTSGASAGWATNDRVIIGSGSLGSSVYGYSFLIDATNVTVYVGTNGLLIPNKGTLSVQALPTSDWDISVLVY